MRIISGIFKGKSINYLKNATTRPLKDSVKENIFNILKHSNLIDVKIENSNILDLYSGVGSFGLESISRGAKKVTFVEENKNTADILKKNLIKLSISNKAIMINDKVENIIGKNKKEKFNIFFLDPPFIKKDFIQVLNLIKKNKVYQTKHIIIIHREKRTEDYLDELISTVLSKKYGRSKIIFGVFK
jgi:16S rRNA (guanine966-N2)-methyltransferase